MPDTKSHVALFAAIQRESLNVIEAYAKQLQESTNDASIAERVTIFEQLSTLHQYAYQWKQIGQKMIQMMTANAALKSSTMAFDHKLRTQYGEVIQYGLNSQWRYRRPVAFEHQRKHYEVNQWLKIVMIIFANAIREHGDSFVVDINQRAQAAPTIAQDILLYKNPGKYARERMVEGWYFDSNLSSDMIADYIKLVYQTLQLPYDSFTVWVLDKSTLNHE